MPEAPTYSLTAATTVKAAAGHRVLLAAKWRNNRLLLTDVPSDMMYLRSERMLAVDSEGRLVLEKLNPRRPAADDEPAVQSDRILDSHRIVFEKR